MSQKEYISSLTQAEERSEEKEELLSITESDCLQLKIGQLLWVSGQTRSSASYETCQLLNKLKNGNIEDMVHANKIIRSLIAQDVCLSYENLGDDSSPKLVVYADAAHGNLPGSTVSFLGQN